MNEEEFESTRDESQTNSLVNKKEAGVVCCSPVSPASSQEVRTVVLNLFSFRSLLQIFQNLGFTLFSFFHHLPPSHP